MGLNMPIIGLKDMSMPGGIPPAPGPNMPGMPGIPGIPMPMGGMPIGGGGIN